MVTLLALLAGSLVAPTGARSAAVEVGYRDFSYSTSITAPTGQKPESKLWYADGTWWGALWNNTVRRLEIHRFNQATQATNAWTATGTIIDSRRNSEADTLWDGSKLYVLTHMKDTDTTATDLGLKFQRFGYSTTTKKYTLEASKTVVNKKAEAAVLDKDSTGKLWVTYTTENTAGGREVRVAHSTTSDTTWIAPYVLPASGANNLSLDDISTLVAYRDTKTGTRRIGVLWSNESAGPPTASTSPATSTAPATPPPRGPGPGCAPPPSAPMTTSTSSRSTPTPPATSTPRSRRPGTTPPPPTPPTR